MSVLIGIDQSYSSTGFFVLDLDGNILEFGIKSAKKCDDMDIFKRAWYISSQLIEVVSKYENPRLCLEGLSFAQIGSATRDLAGLQFTIINNFRELHNYKDITIVPPTSLKKFALGKGKGSKQEMLESMPKDVQEQMILHKYKKSNGLYDLADAYWLSQYIKSIT